MSARAKLRRLGQLYGIEPGYTDFWGRRRRVTATTERALLEAMGIAAGSEREIALSLREAAARPWQRLLAPVRVLAPPDPLEVTFSLPRSRAGARVRWSLLEEAGGVHEGEAVIDDLPAVAEAEVEGERYARWRLRLPHELPLGYHQFQLSVGAAAGEVVRGSSGLIVAPPRCFLPEEEPDGGHRLWGLACQLYGLRSERNWGMGDFTDLARLAEQAAGLGAAAIGVNPLHALFPADPGHISPYSPSSRLFLNVLYIDPEAVPELAESPEAQAMLAGDGFQAELRGARGAELVDYPAVARLKLPILEHLYAAFRRRHLASPESARGRAFRAFLAEMGLPLERHVVFDALHEHAIRNFGAWAWQHWPEPYRHPDSPEVAAFAAGHRERVEFFAYLQWLADGQLADAQARARAAGMPVGLYQDLAVAVNPASSVAWANPGVSLSEVSAGAPPDWFNPNGQNWVLSPLSPVGLRESRYGMFIEALRHNMRHAGAVRIDHVMGLKRLFWIPAGAGAAAGAYVRYPVDDLVRIIALESRRHRCLVIGEDLGTVPRGFRPAMQRAGLMSCRVFYFERDRKGAFLAPESYPEHALVSASTHDLPTLRGFWTCRDVRWRELLHMFPDEAAHAGARAERDRDRRLMLEGLERAGLLPEGLNPARPPDELPDELVLAVHRFLARTPGRVLMVQLEDALGEAEQPNLPGANEYPAWKRRLARQLEDFGEHPLFRRLIAAVAAEGRSARGARRP